MEEPFAETMASLQKQMAKKQTFESSVLTLAGIVKNRYASASPSDQNLMYGAVCRAGTLLQTRYTSPGFWMVGLDLFQEAERVVSKPKERNHLKSFITRAHEHIGEKTDRDETLAAPPAAGQNMRFLFEGQLTVGPEPPPPAWLTAQNFLSTMVAGQENAPIEVHIGEGSSQNDRTSVVVSSGNEGLTVELENLMQRLQNDDEFRAQVEARVRGSLNNTDLQAAIEASMQDNMNTCTGPPPASKEVVAKLPVINITEDDLHRLGKETECSVCKETFGLEDKMQEMPCKHLFHPDCLKPWLDEHNSCPICRHELRTDDHNYESMKERDRRFKEERKGAENAVRGGELMYI